MTTKFKVTMDSSKEKSFCVHLPDKIVVFKQMKNDLYVMDTLDPKSFITKENYNSKRVQFAGVNRNTDLSEVKDSLQYISERQKNRSKMARKAFQDLGISTIDDFKAMLCMNLIRNAKIATEYINFAQKAFVPDVASIKGKTTRSLPLLVRSNVIEIPPELLKINEDIVLSIDVLSVNSLKFLTTVSHNVFHRTGHYISDAYAQNYEYCMQEVYNVY